LSPAKNQLESVKAVERLKEAIPNIRLLLVGAGVGSYERVLRRYVCEKSLQSYVKFLGFQPREVIRDLYHISDIIVHPVKEQGGWLTPFEALCAAKPIVVSHQMTAADIIKKENIGVVTDDLVSAILQIYRSPKEYRRMGLKGQRYVAENLSWESFGRRMLSLFERVLSTHK
jgi:glycosyltransferase involved in cell wall biosynthesis